MSFLKGFLDNHVFANLVFALVIITGVVSFVQMPRAKESEINFNWINIMTLLPGASAEDIEERVTDPLEDSIRSRVSDIRFVSSMSRSGVSNILVRFRQIDDRTFDKRVADLRREVQNTYSDEITDDAENPEILEVTASSAYPSAMVLISAEGSDENLYRRVRSIRKDLERIPGVFQVNEMGLPESELHISFDPEKIAGLGVSPVDIADTVRAYFRDTSAGDIDAGTSQWLVRIDGTDDDPERLAQLPIVTAQGVIPLAAIARLERAPEEANELVKFTGRPGVLLTITKQPEANVIDLVDSIRAFVDEKNNLSEATGTKIALVDDQTVSTRDALRLMQTNAMIGFSLVLLVTWIFLGTRIAVLTSIGIPFTLCGTFIVLNAGGVSINNSVLLGIVIALGMIVDDAVVVVEAMSRQLQQGVASLDAAVNALREVFAPVTTSVMTTMAAFLPLMLLPGILGEFMRIIPLCVSLALFISLFEAYWMLPAHVAFARGKNATVDQSSWRVRFSRWIRHRYSVILLRLIRRPWIVLIVVFLAMCSAGIALMSGRISYDFFAGDPEPVLYLNIEMSRGATLDQTLTKAVEIEELVLSTVTDDEIRATLAYSGQMFTETEPLFGDTVGQVFLSLSPKRDRERDVTEIADAIEEKLALVEGVERVSLLRFKGGPPSGRDLSVKVLGDDFTEIDAASQSIIRFLEGQDGTFTNITTDFRPGDPQLVLRLKGDAIKRAGVDPTTLARAVALFVDGEIVASFHSAGDDVKVRVRPNIKRYDEIGNLLRQTIVTADGGRIAIGDLVHYETGLGQQEIRHFNFRRAITIESDIDKERTDSVRAADDVKEYWSEIRQQYPNVTLDFTGILDDIQEALDSMLLLAVFGVCMIYAILGTQFKSYLQPILILFTIPLALLGVILGLAITGNPISLYTMYGVVALMGISVNAAIVLISTANARRRAGMNVIHATVYAGRRRVIPIIITSLTTIAGLFSLAVGVGGKSLVWGPVATSIVAGLLFSTVLTLLVIPLLYRGLMALLAWMGRLEQPASVAESSH